MCEESFLHPQDPEHGPLLDAKLTEIRTALYGLGTEVRTALYGSGEVTPSPAYTFFVTRRLQALENIQKHIINTSLADPTDIPRYHYNGEFQHWFSKCGTSKLECELQEGVLPPAGRR